MLNKLKQLIVDYNDKKAQKIFNIVLSQDSLTPKYQIGMCVALNKAYGMGLISNAQRVFAHKQIEKFLKPGDYLYLSEMLIGGIVYGYKHSITALTKNARTEIYSNWKDRHEIVDEFRKKLKATINE